MGTLGHRRADTLLRHLTLASLLALAAACGKGEGQLGVFPTALDYGAVDFLLEMPEEGYASTELLLTNTGEEPLTLTLLTLDLDHLCVPGFTSAPTALPDLDPGSSYSLFVGVCDYIEEDGERDSEVKGRIEIEGDNLPQLVAVPWSFTPVLGLEEEGAAP
jgi:hypothetical protein